MLVRYDSTEWHRYDQAVPNYRLATRAVESTLVGHEQDDDVDHHNDTECRYEQANLSVAGSIEILSR